MKVFVISLLRAKDRREYIMSHLAERKLDYELVDAVDYMDLTSKDYMKLSDQEAVRKNPYLSKGAIACSLSHLKIYRKMVQENIDSALILEDDAHLPSNIKKILDAVEKQIGLDEIVTLSYYNHHISKPTTHLSKYNRTLLEGIGELVYPIDLHDIASAMAYIITKKVASKMADVIMPVSVTADYWGVYYDRGAFNTFRCVYPIPVTAALLRSSIDYDAAKTFMSKLALFIRKYRVPILLPFLNRRAINMQNNKYNFELIDVLPFNGEVSSVNKDLNS